MFLFLRQGVYNITVSPCILCVPYVRVCMCVCVCVCVSVGRHDWSTGNHCACSGHYSFCCWFAWNHRGLWRQGGQRLLQGNCQGCNFSQRVRTNLYTGRNPAGSQDPPRNFCPYQRLRLIIVSFTCMTSLDRHYFFTFKFLDRNYLGQLTSHPLNWPSFCKGENKKSAN